MIKKQRGFTLVELIIFIVITGLLASTILLSMRIALVSTPITHYQFIANQLANQCMEGFIGERHLLTSGYNNTNLACSPTPPLPSVCSSPTGYTTSAAITCTPTLSGDATNSKTVTVTVTGLANATLTLLMAGY
jgi:prepilin-type N-terminal cleavage/methylation domain-containing protein